MSWTVSAVFVATDTALTVGNVCRALKPLEGMVMGDGLAYFLNVPESKRVEVERNHPKPPDQLREVVSYYLTRCPSHSWRGVIWAVECMKAHHVADMMRERAEPVRGMQYRECWGGCSVAGSLWQVPSGRDSIIIYNIIFIYTVEPLYNDH